MKRYNIPHCSIREIDRNGIAHCMEKMLDMINRRWDDSSLLWAGSSEWLVQVVGLILCHSN